MRKNYRLKTIQRNDMRLIVETWNKLGLSQVTNLTKGTIRYEKLENVLDLFTLDEILETIKSIDKSSFLKGQTNRDFIITFDWLINLNNFKLVFDGKYIDIGGCKEKSLSIDDELYQISLKVQALEDTIKNLDNFEKRISKLEKNNEKGKWHIERTKDVSIKSIRLYKEVEEQLNNYLAMHKETKVMDVLNYAILDYINRR